MMRDPAVNSLQHPTPAAPLTPVNFDNLAPKPNAIDSLSNILGTVGAFSGALSPWMQKQPNAVTQTPAALRPNPMGRTTFRTQ